MRCIVCNQNLKDHESVRRHGITNEFLDICDGCLREIPGLPTKGGHLLDSVSNPFDGIDDTTNVELDNVTNCYTLKDEDD